MPYLRMLTNAVVGGALVGAYVTLLVLQLNPGVELRSFGVARLMLTWWIFYGMCAAIFFYVLIVARKIVGADMKSPGWLSLRLLAQIGTLAASLAAAVTWLNLRGFRVVLGPDAAARMTSGATILTACAAVCVLLSAVQLPLARGRRTVALVFAAVLFGSLAGPLVLRGRGAPSSARSRTRTVTGIAPMPSSARVSMILLDGASLDFIAPAAARGRVPNFGRLLESGAVMHLATLRPTQPATVWTAVSTGKLPYKTTVYSAGQYLVPGSADRLDLLPDYCFAQSLLRFHLLEQQDPTSDAVGSLPIWELISSFGISAGVIDWPVTYPAHPLTGYIVTDEFLRRGEASVVSASAGPPLVWPPELFDSVHAARLRPTPKSPFAGDSAIEAIARDLSSSAPAQFVAVRYPGLDAVGHYYLRYAVPRAFGDVSDEERLRFGRVLEQYYTYVDGVVGRAMDALGPDDLLLVVSGFGMEPLGFGKRALERLAGDPELSGSHENAPDGFLMAYGRSVAKGTFQRASVLDVTPTVLYFLGLPIGRDMDGFARTDIFAPIFTAQRPITFIPYYDR